MKVLLFNPMHNGDILYSSGIVGHIIKSNPTIQFILIPSCCSILYKQYQTSNVVIEEHPLQWNMTHSMRTPSKYNHIIKMQTSLFQVIDDTIYINMWKLMLTDFGKPQPQRGSPFANLYNKQEHIIILFNEIFNTTGLKLEFNVSDYKQLIPIIPKMDISYIENAIRSKGKSHIILFYNFNGYSGQEKYYPPNFNDKKIIQLLKMNNDSLLILPNSSIIKHENILNLEDDLGVQKHKDGSSLVLYGNICEICDEVHFKDNGGSLFQLNQSAINNPRTKYYFHNNNTQDNSGDIFKNVYGLNCELVTDL